LKITPGHDGVFGKIEIFSPEERGKEAVSEEPEQMGLF
jgi:hypothetical protein